MMTINQTRKLWASLSPRLVRAASDHLTSNSAPDTEEQVTRTRPVTKRETIPFRKFHILPATSEIVLRVGSFK